LLHRPREPAEVVEDSELMGGLLDRTSFQGPDNFRIDARDPRHDRGNEAEDPVPGGLVEQRVESSGPGDACGRFRRTLTAEARTGAQGRNDVGAASRRRHRYLTSSTCPPRPGGGPTSLPSNSTQACAPLSFGSRGRPITNCTSSPCSRSSRYSTI